MEENPFNSSHFAWCNLCIERMSWKGSYYLPNIFKSYRDKFSTCYIDYQPEKLTKNLHDLDLKNYQLFDILGLFEIPYDYTDIHVDKAKVKTKNIEQIISSFKPPIFWKEKDIVKKQLKIWSKESLYQLIKDLNKIELLVKKNTDASKSILYNFVVEKSDFNNTIS